MSRSIAPSAARALPTSPSRLQRHRGGRWRAAGCAAASGHAAAGDASNILPRPPRHHAPMTDLGPRLAKKTGAAPTAPAPLIWVQSAAELHHLLLCHPHRLIVLHVAASDCPLSTAFQPLLRQVMYGRGDALFLGLALQPREAAAQGRSGLVLLGDRAELAQRLGVTRLPCTLLLRGDRLLARLEFATGAAAQPAAVAAAAVRQLEAALDDQGLGRGVPNGVSPHPGAMPEAPAPAPAGRN